MEFSIYSSDSADIIILKNRIQEVLSSKINLNKHKIHVVFVETVATKYPILKKQENKTTYFHVYIITTTDVTYGDFNYDGKPKYFSQFGNLNGKTTPYKNYVKFRDSLAGSSLYPEAHSFLDPVDRMVEKNLVTDDNDKYVPRHIVEAVEYSKSSPISRILEDDMDIKTKVKLLKDHVREVFLSGNVGKYTKFDSSEFVTDDKIFEVLAVYNKIIDIYS